MTSPTGEQALPYGRNDSLPLEEIALLPIDFFRRRPPTLANTGKEKRG